MDESADSSITQILARVRRGDRDAVGELTPLIYDRLRRIARAHLRGQRPDHTLQTTALAHEAFLQLVAPESVSWQDRAHFFNAAAQVTRQVLIHHARRSQARKRGGGRRRIPLDASLIVERESGVDVLVLDEALDRLAALNPRHGRIVELRFFGGLDEAAIAEVLGVSERTVRREWQGARAWLHREIGRRSAE